VKKFKWLVLSVSMLLVIVLAFTGCNNTSPTTTASHQPASTTPSTTTTPPASTTPMQTTTPPPTTGTPSGQITEAGSTTVQPLAEKLAAAFSEDYPDITVIIQGGGSGVGVKSAQDGTADIGAASRELTAEEIASGLVEFVLAKDGIAIIAHPSQTITNLTVAQIKDIFSGAITNWSQVGGANKTIHVVAREEGSGTRAAFEEMVMGKNGPVIVANAILQPSNGALRTTVAGDADAIGFLSFGYLDSSVKAFSVESIAATVANAKSGVYPIVRPLLFLTGSQPTGIVKQFIDYCLSYKGQAMVESEGYIAVGPTVEMKGTITEAGSTTVQPLAEEVAAAFMAKYPDITVIIQGGGSGVGVKSAQDGTADIGAASRELTAEEIASGLVEHVLAKDGIAIIAHPSQTITNLTVAQIKDIFSGAITNWSQVGGANKTIHVVAREEGSGTRAAFEEMVMGKNGPVIVANAILQPSNGALRTTVAGDSDAIGFLSFGYLDSSVKAFSVEGIAATVANAKSGVYPIVRPLLFLTGSQPTGIVKEFIDFFLSPEGQAIVAQDYITVN
jgi:phosphate transport system substrate-binding protein